MHCHVFNKFSTNKQLLLLQRLSKNVMRINMMRITCPNCHTAYDVPDHLLAASSRPLRCSVCGNSWVRAQPAPILATPTPATAPAPVRATKPVPSPAPVPESPPEPAPAPVAEAVAETEPAPEPEVAEVPPAPVAKATEPPKELSAPPRVTKAQGPSQGEWNGNSSAWPLISLVVIGVLLALLGVAVLERTEIMHLFPASTQIFRALGLA